MFVCDFWGFCLVLCMGCLVCLVDGLWLLSSLGVADFNCGWFVELVEGLYDLLTFMRLCVVVRIACAKFCVGCWFGVDYFMFS